LDIPKGARWDDAIEAAVERSSTFMIVLAPESIESQNVKDELSYAIDSGKNLLPVVIKPCKIPLRLRRFQYVDFTDKPYKESLADIKRLLSNTQRLAKPLPLEPTPESGEPSPLVTGPLIAPEVMTSHEPLHRDESGDKDRLRRFILPVGLGAIALAVVAGVTVFALNRNTPPPPSPPTFTSTQPLPTSTSTNTAIPPPAQIIDEHRITMRLVSAGDFIMGSDSGMEDEQPVKILFLDAFYIDKYEVTNLQYKACVGAGACLSPKEVESSTRTDYYNNAEFNNYPVVNVDWNMARSYCEWRGARLPTEAEWEKAARGPEGSTYPWGDEVSCNEANYFGCQEDTAPVSSFGNGLSEYGVHNMAGNVIEWVSSLYLPYPYDMFDGREDLEASGERVLRGGSWLDSDSENEVRSAYRQMADPSHFSENIGFRCVRDDPLLDFGLIVNAPENASTATAYVATSRSDRTKEAEEPTATVALIASRTPTPGDVTVTAITVTRRPTITPTQTPRPINTTTTPEPVETTVTPDTGPEPDPTTVTPSYP
jgi:formylglycine-generating enzyme required for sulfatase activity